jgi:hypothetical protein
MIVKVGGQLRLWLALWLLMICVETPLEARISPAERQRIDKVLGSTGEYVAAEDTYKFVFPSGDEGSSPGPGDPVVHGTGVMGSVR